MSESLVKQKSFEFALMIIGLYKQLVVMPFVGKTWRMATEIRRCTLPGFPLDLLVRTPEQVAGGQVADAGADDEQGPGQGHPPYSSAIPLPTCGGLRKRPRMIIT